MPEAIRHLLPLVLLAGLGGCSCSDGGFVYRVSGRLVDRDAKSVANKAVGVQLSADTATAPSGSIVQTDSDGRFVDDDVRTGLAWGCTRLFDIIPLNDPAPKPPKLKMIYLAAERAPGDWAYKDVSLSPQQQKSPGTVELGNVKSPE